MRMKFHGWCSFFICLLCAKNKNQLQFLAHIFFILQMQMYKSCLAHMFHEVQGFGTFQVYMYSAYILSWECHTSKALAPMKHLIFGTSSIEEYFHSFYKCMLILSPSTLLGKSLSSSPISLIPTRRLQCRVRAGFAVEGVRSLQVFL